jgi:uncharacterized protein (TIGR02145 family)
MRTFLFLALISLFTSFSAQETLTYPYNPDGNVDGSIAAPDLLDILGVYGNAFTPTEIEIDGVNLLQVIQDLQNQIASIPIIDVNYVESTLAVLQQEIDNLNQQIAENALPDGTASGQLLRWNGTAWIPVSPFGCTDSTACNYDNSAIIDDDSCTIDDECEVCGGDNSTCLDDCGVLNGDNSTCLGCDGVPNSGLVYDECEVCGGDNSTCLDDCGVLNGDNSTCTDCLGVLYGDGLVSHAGHNYSTVQIGEKCWFAENCRYLPEVSPSSEGSYYVDGVLPGQTSPSETDPYYYVYDYEGTDVTAAQATVNYATYGVLYNWPAVMTAGICPSGWHIPTDEEFTELTDFLGGEIVAGVKMKSTYGWNGANGSNSSGFTGLPGGYRNSGEFGLNGTIGYWWSASESGSYSWIRELYYGLDNVIRSHGNRYYGFSARCVRD